MPHVTEANTEMVPAIINLLEQEFANPDITAEMWHNMLLPPWRLQHDPVGYVLLDGSRIVGFIATIYAEYRKNGKTHRLCNLSSFVTRLEYRTDSIKLLQPIRTLANCTVTNFTPQKTVAMFMQRMGFVTLEECMHIILPLPYSSAWISSLLTHRIVPERAFAKLLDPEDCRIYRDHQLPTCCHLLVQSCRTGDFTYIVYSPTKGKRRWFNRIHYISNEDVFWSALGRIFLALCRHGRIPLIMLPPRLVSHVPLHGRGIRTVELASKPLFRPDGETATPEVPGLYSELTLLKI